VYCYPLEHYATWQRELGLPELPCGGFGENFTTRGLLETEICIGDTFQIGSAVVQVAQPRRPCYKLNRRLGVPDLDARLDAARRCGWYLRVLREGEVQAGEDFVLVERQSALWDIGRVYAILQDVPGHLAEAGALLEVPALAENWRASLRRKLQA
jgi:MOSC domain-containing protein YiiM